MWEIWIHSKQKIMLGNWRDKCYQLSLSPLVSEDAAPTRSKAGGFFYLQLKDKQ